MIRDYLNVYQLEDMQIFLLGHGQLIDYAPVDGTTPPITYYFDENSMAVVDGVNVLKPDDIDPADPGRFLKKSINCDWLQMANKPVLFDGNYNSLSNKPSLFSGAYNDLTGKPNLFSGNYNDLTNKPVIPTNTNQLTNGSGFLTGITNTQVTNALGLTPIDLAGSRNAISLTTTGTSGNATYNSSTGVLNIPNYTSSAINRSFNNSAVKTINGTGVQISTTRDSIVSYTITHSIALTLLLASGSSQVFLEISQNNSTWTTISQAGYSDGVSVAVALTKTTTNNVQGVVPAGWYVRLRAVTSGAGSASYTAGQEVLL